MPRYRVLRDFGSHLGNHYVGEMLNLPDGPLPRGFAGFVEKLPEPVQKDVVPASGRANDDVGAADVRAAQRTPEAGLVPRSSGDVAPEESPSPAPRAPGYDDKMLRADEDRPRKRRP